MIKELKINNGYIYANREIDSEDINDPKILILWYRAAGYKTVTIRNIMKIKCPDLTNRQINNTISNFARSEGLKFRPYSNDKKEWDQWYKDQAMKQLGKPFEGSEFTENRPLNAGDYRKIKGTTKAEKRLLRSIKK